MGSRVYNEVEVELIIVRAGWLGLVEFSGDMTGVYELN